MATPTCVKQFRTAMEKELAQVVYALAKQFNFDADEGIKFLKSGSKTRKVVAKKAKMTPEQKVARELAKAAIKKARQNDRDAKKAAKLAEREKAKAAKLAEREKVKAAKLAEKEAAKAAKLAEKAKAKADKDAEKAAAKESKAVAKLTAKLAKLFDLEELDGNLKKRAGACQNSDQLKELAIVVKAELRAKKMRQTQIRKLAEKRAKLVTEIRDLAKHCGGGINFSENEIETADMDGLKEIRKTIKKCIRKLERADAKACDEEQRRVDNAKFAGQMGNICC